ncbi:GNAT family N-acetyltransferase [Pseudomonas atagonensis]|uniref:GNAT family N-acetyltransferase n=1 Tax=Pseudomonas atagonensis TaxID=2609964 RepID=UPI00140AF858|nr:GNAT family N-acetyltransferase [Pseudomonas atagonensis]
MEAPICIGPATRADAGIICRIIERSIRVGCALDHRNEVLCVNAWISRQSADLISAWLADPHRYLSIASAQGKPIGVGMASDNGDILFCYVLPEWFRRGAGRALMTDMEGWLQIRGSARAHLDSTRTAEAFYRRLGYQASAPQPARRRLKTLPMYKRLALSG